MLKTAWTESSALEGPGSTDPTSGITWAHVPGNVGCPGLKKEVFGSNSQTNICNVSVMTKIRELETHK